MIDWINGECINQNLYLQDPIEIINGIKIIFRRISFTHVYKENNLDVDNLEKKAIKL